MLLLMCGCVNSHVSVVKNHFESDECKSAFSDNGTPPVELCMRHRTNHDYLIIYDVERNELGSFTDEEMKEISIDIYNKKLIGTCSANDRPASVVVSSVLYDGIKCNLTLDGNKLTQVIF